MKRGGEGCNHWGKQKKVFLGKEEIGRKSEAVAQKKPTSEKNQRDADGS